MVLRMAPILVVLAAAVAMAVPAGAQPSAPDPEAPAEGAPAGEAPEAPEASEGPPASPAEAAARREDRLEALFARLSDEETKDWQSVQDEIWRVWSRSGSASMDLLLERANDAMKEGDPELALRFLNDLVRLDPDFAEGWNQRATVYFRLGEYGRSVADIERVLALEPRHFGALSGLAMILERLGDEEGAYKAYKQALAVHPNLPGAEKAVERLAPEVEGREL